MSKKNTNMSLESSTRRALEGDATLIQGNVQAIFVGMRFRLMSNESMAKSLAYWAPSVIWSRMVRDAVKEYQTDKLAW